jgi:membrane-bound serine protease (ClpP class)
MGWWLVLAVILFLACAALLIAEVFIPSGGILSIFSMGCLMAGLVIFFKHNTTMGIVGITVALIMIPAVLIIAYRILPDSKFGKKVFLSPPVRQKGDAIPDMDHLKDMLGAVGSVITPLRPVGMADFDGSRIECVSESGFIDNEKNVKIIKVEGTQLTVRVVDEK